MRQITIRLEVPDDVEVRVNGESPTDYEVPLPAPWAPSNGVHLMPAIATVPLAVAGGCPVHHTAWRIVPAGISKRSGKPYGEFRACPTVGCDERPR